jgi:hypothetical protein
MGCADNMDIRPHVTLRIGKTFLPYVSTSAKILIALFVVTALFLTDSTSQATTSTEPYSVLVIAGQSNAQGDMSFHTNMNPPLGSHPADSATKIMWSTGDDQLSVVRRMSSSSELLPLTTVQPEGFFGPEVGLARSLWDQGRRNMVILKVTYGLQRLAATQNDVFGGLADWNTNSVNESYDNLKLRKSQLATLMNANNETYTMDGFYWVQGESDAVKGETVANYQSNLNTLLDSVHEDLDMHPDSINVLGKISGQYCLTNVYNLIYNPEGCGVQACVLAVHPCSTPEIVSQGNTNVRTAIQNIADIEPETFVVETEDLARGPDWIHLTASSQLTLGTRMSNSSFQLPYRNEGSDDYDGDGIPNADEDINGDGNLGNDDSDFDLVPDYLDEIFGEGGGPTQNVGASKSVEDRANGTQSVTRQGSTLDWMYSLSNDTQTPASIDIEENISSRQSYVSGSFLAPPNFVKQYSTDGGRNV